MLQRTQRLKTCLRVAISTVRLVHLPPLHTLVVSCGIQLWTMANTSEPQALLQAVYNIISNQITQPINTSIHGVTGSQ